MNGTRISNIIILIIIISFLNNVAAQTINDNNDFPPNITLFHNFGSNLLHAFINDNGAYHLTAVASSYGLVESGIDWDYYRIMRDDNNIGYIAFPSVIIGGIAPLVVPLYLYFQSKSDEDAKLMYTSYALGQAAIMSYIVSTSYKAITGRDGPEIFDDDGSRSDYSKSFHFGIFENGTFDGWPSGHTTSAVAMATTLIELYPDNNTIKTGAIIYAAFIGIGISTNIHWFSDFVAGTLIGYSIGKSVGSSFKYLMDGKDSENNFSITPTNNGIRFTYLF